MPADFSRSLRSLGRDGFGRSVAGLSLAIVLIASWVAWFALAHVELYEVSATARLEIDQSTHVIQAPVAGRVLQSSLALGREVRAGDPLLDIECEAQRLELHESETRLATLAPQLDALRSELAAQEQAGTAESLAAASAIEQSRAARREFDATRELADLEAARVERLYQRGLLSRSDYDRALAEARGRGAGADALQLSTSRLERDKRRAENERQAQVQRLRNDIARLEAERAATSKVIDRLQFEINRRHVVAPVDGRLGDVTILRPGAFVEEGARLCAVIPKGRIHIVADFVPAAALGRIREGQAARMRLHGFPWSQYGAVRAVVERVGDEVRDGHVRVELQILQPAPPAVPLQHGLPGVVEVRVESVTPAVLTLRTAGLWLTRTENQFR